ncbi:MAG TPA: CoA transferase, partial [Solirubrobacteraceae bacterium]|nr:CoA transferase [Solirubrobacteraceae bacterium]
NDSRVRHRDELVAVLAPAFRARPAREWLDRLDAAGVPAGKVRGVREAFQAAARAGEPATVEVAHPTAGRIPLVRSPIRGAGVAPSPAPPPLLGQHTAEVLAELDLPVPDPPQEPRS